MSFFDSRTLREASKIDYDQIAKMAYLKWETAGCPERRDQEFWFRAETEYARTHGLWDWDSGPFKVGDDYYIETVDGIRQKLSPGAEGAVRSQHHYPEAWKSCNEEWPPAEGLKQEEDLGLLRPLIFQEICYPAEKGQEP
jgi:hypothetical protein